MVEDLDFGAERSGRDYKRERGRAETVKEKQLPISSRVFGKIRIEVSGSESTTTEPSPRVTSHKCEVLKPVVSVRNSGHVQLFVADIGITPLYRLKQRLVLRLFCGHHNASTHLP